MGRYSARQKKGFTESFTVQIFRIAKALSGFQSGVISCNIQTFSVVSHLLLLFGNNRQSRFDMGQTGTTKADRGPKLTVKFSKKQIIIFYLSVESV